MSIGIGAVKIADGAAGIGEGGVGYERSAGGAAGAVESEGKGCNRADAGEEVLVWRQLGDAKVNGKGGNVHQDRLL